ncbi:MAG: hypothetical protein A3H98_04905 [Bacteroidetes bacterium RIFCSPLOWO2_02_FULL_36_8]|nr:MAG: hypothetical protein A3H98_04905 [Bacteroidetes bacterium RIFCSPLOWO2_02_FULL_36_8]OFY72018.1 MAG: hypothetical protein A3G23_00285 [Bacteroidetes bacterium RIFCSPLOWO2_12_FULL_37_12]
MRKYLYSIFLYLFIISNSIAQHTISGRITDILTHTAIPLVNIYIPDLKRGAASDENGRFKIEHLPDGKYLMILKHIGYASIVEKIAIIRDTIMEFQLVPTVTEYDDIIVTGTSAATERKENPIPVVAISKENLNQTISTNIIDATAKIPGVSQITTGTGISKPVIRGLSGNRIIVLQNNIRQEGQTWGEEHGIEADEYAIDHVEIIKGPGSILYGSDAMGGVINLQPSYIPEIGKIKSELFTTFQTNNSLYGYSLVNSGNLNGFHWLIRGGQKMSGNYSNSYDGTVFNSGFNEKNFNGTIGLIKKWGFANLHTSSFNQIIGLPSGERNASGQFLREVVLNDSIISKNPVTEKEINSSYLFDPKQKIEHYRAQGEVSHLLGKFRFNFDIVAEINKRMEFETYIPQYSINPFNPLNAPDSAAIILNKLNFYLQEKIFIPEIYEIEPTLGFNFDYHKNSIGGREFIIPSFQEKGVGIFSFFKKSIMNFHFSGGIRWDIFSIQTDGINLDSTGHIVSQNDLLNSEYKFYPFLSRYSNGSYTFGVSYKINKNHVIKLNMARGFRSPNISELSANGHHHGTDRYETGDTLLKSETNLQYDAGYVLNSEHFTFEISAFRNFVKNYIFSHKLTSRQGGDSVLIDDEGGEILNVFNYVQNNALLFGGEISMDLHPHPYDWLHFENNFSLVMGELSDLSGVTQYLPFIPEPRYISELHAFFKNIRNRFINCFIKVEWEIHLPQKRFYSLYNTETFTSGYNLWNTGTGFDFTTKKGLRICQFTFSVNNLLDVSYQNHLNRLKYIGYNPATGRIGLYNMGRNFSVKLIFPFEWNVKRN